MAMRSHSQRTMNRLDAPHWLIEVGGIAKLDHIRLLAQAIEHSKFHFDATEFASKLTRDKSEPMRRVIYQAVMYVSANCPYTELVKEVQKDGSTKLVNKECHLTYSQALHALITNDAGAFKGNLQDDVSAEERSMAHKWELFRQGFYVYTDAIRRKAFDVSETKPFICLCGSKKPCARRCPDALATNRYNWDVQHGQQEAIREAAKPRILNGKEIPGIEIRMK